MPSEPPQRPLLLERFSKSAAAILGVGQAFFAENQLYLESAARQATLYAKGPPRLRCKLCDERLPEAPDFVKSGVGYMTCRACTHLNGQWHDTPEFHHAVHAEETYAGYYSSRDVDAFARRAAAIYAPKVAFLSEALALDGKTLADLSVTDFGCGSGYLLAALAEAGVSAQGVEVDQVQAAFGEEMLTLWAAQSSPPAAPGPITLFDVEDSAAALASVRTPIVSMIGVLEHLQDMRGALDALSTNPHVRYFYLCAPLSGLCVFLEAAFPDVFPRHLAGDHTHLFTDRSLATLERNWGWERRAAWWFGSDMLDLYRFVGLRLVSDPALAGLIEPWQARMEGLIDSMQHAIDVRREASEVHLLFSK